MCMQKNVWIVIFLCSFLFSCSSRHNEAFYDILSLDLDTTVLPYNDYFQYANGGWIKKNLIPADQTSWGIGDLVINENLSRLKHICEDLSKQKLVEGSNEQKIADFYTAAMDTMYIEKEGLSPLTPYLQEIAAIKNKRDIFPIVAQLNTIGVYSLIGMSISPDDKNSSRNMLQLYQAGIHLGNRDYYFLKDSIHQQIRQAYTQYIRSLLSLSGYDTVIANQEAMHILALETEIAGSHLKLEDTRDPYKNYFKFSTTTWQERNPIVNFTAYYKNLGIQSLDSIIVHQPNYYFALNQLINHISINDWKAYLQFSLIDRFTFALPDTFDKVAFAFTKVLLGIEQQKPRWKRVIRSEEANIGELLGQLYVKQYFSERAKERYANLVEAIRHSLANRIMNLSWMEPATKEKALYKLSKMTKKVGYPDHWKDFSALSISKKSYIDNLIHTSEWWNQYNINKLNKPVDKTEWDMLPQTYNAYYNPSNNEIVLPAGIFTVPGYTNDSLLDDGLVYGYAAASTIGHEMTHGFDDQGRLYDAEGNLHNWWTAKDSAQFAQRAKQLVNQYNQYVVVDTFKENGAATLGENIADLGGVLLAWDAFKLTDCYKKNQFVSGLLPAERFFLGYALGWLYENRPKELLNQVLTDVHAVPYWRVNGVMVNVDGFYDVYHPLIKSKMYLADSLRVYIW